LLLLLPAVAEEEEAVADEVDDEGLCPAEDEAAAANERWCPLAPTYILLLMLQLQHSIIIPRKLLLTVSH